MIHDDIGAKSRLMWCLNTSREVLMEGLFLSNPSAFLLKKQYIAQYGGIGGMKKQKAI
jgi:hypothetical protein